MKHDLDYMISVMQAAKEGKEIECSQIVSMFENWIPVENPLWDWASYHYRIKPEEPEPKYVPYESAEEFIQAQKEHGMYIYSSPANIYILPNCVRNEGVVFEEKITYPSLIEYAELLQYRWADGSPCGKLKE